MSRYIQPHSPVRFPVMDAIAADETCPDESCGHKGWVHDLRSGCMVETWDTYCPCGLAPVIKDSEVRWPLALDQRV